MEQEPDKTIHIDMKEVQEKLDKEKFNDKLENFKNHSCPYCDRCPHCGRPYGHYNYPINPYYPPSYPFHQAWC